VFASAFVYKEGGTLKVLTYSKFTSKLKETLDKCGIDTPSEEEKQALLCIAVCLATILSFRVTGNLMRMNDI